MNMISEFLPIPAAMTAAPDQYYSRASRLLVLEGPRGRLLAHYMSHLMPDPARHQFYAFFPEDYAPFDGTAVPRSARADVRAVCWPISQSHDARMTVASSAVPGFEAQAAPAEDDLLLAAPPAPGESLGLLHAAGVKIGRSSLDAYFDGTGLAIDASGISIDGTLNLTKPASKGVTAESPLFGILPKSAVTFWVADYLPYLAVLAAFAGIVTTLKKVMATVEQLIRLLRNLPS